jgi:hypothetical protein
MRSRTRLQAVLALIVVNFTVAPQRAIAQCDSGTVCTRPDCPNLHRTYRQGRWFVLETANFQICCEQSEAPAGHLARHAETLRNLLRAKWLGEDSSNVWSPRCQIVLHSSQRSYVAAVGRGGERTVGSSLVKTDKGRIVSRRVDLLGAGTKFLSAALPHELTHVVLRDCFTSTVVPRWADEGMAILADTKAKQERHFKDLRDAVARRTTFHAAEILTMEEYPSPNRLGAFYGQSASLTKFLVARKSPEQFVKFIDRAREHDYDTALRECYEIASVGELDRQWRQYRFSRQPDSDDEPVQSMIEPYQAQGSAMPLATAAVSSRRPSE